MQLENGRWWKIQLVNSIYSSHMSLLTLTNCCFVFHSFAGSHIVLYSCYTFYFILFRFHLCFAQWCSAFLLSFWLFSSSSRFGHFVSNVLFLVSLWFESRFAIRIVSFRKYHHPSVYHFQLAKQTFMLIEIRDESTNA